jgi:glutathione S-transferase
LASRASSFASDDARHRRVACPYEDEARAAPQVDRQRRRPALTYEEGDLTLFESGAIVLHIAERHAGLLPGDANARARAIEWMFAALNTVEPPIVDLSMATILEKDKSW